MATNDGSLGGLVSGLGGAVSSLFSGQGNAAQAKDFQGAEVLAEQNAQLAAASTRIQETQVARQVSQTLGTQQADIAGAGFTNSGSALDLMKSSAQQGALAKSLVNIQGAIQENTYATQAGAYGGLAKAANEASTAGTIGAIASVGGALISGTGQLISAGKSVVQGVNSVYNYFADSTAPTVAQATDSILSGGADQGGFVGEFPTSIGSTTDTAITDGASLGIDTSGLGIGSTIDSAASAVSDAFSSATSAVSDLGSAIFGSFAADIIPGLGIASLLGSIPAIQDIPVVGPVLQGIGDVVSGITNGVVDAVSSIGDAIGSVFGSVICTALYKRGMLTRSVWYGAQKYGRDIAPAHVYHAYLFWGQPIANTISKHQWFAKLVAPVFVPWAHELAVLAGEKTAKSTMRGRTIFKITYVFSSVLGKCIYKGDRHVARA